MTCLLDLFNTFKLVLFQVRGELYRLLVFSDGQCLESNKHKQQHQELYYMRRESIKDTDHERLLRLGDLQDDLPLLVLDDGVFQKEFLVRLLPNRQRSQIVTATSTHICGLTFPS